MRKHLFYTFLIIFVLTAVITLLGILGWVKIDDFYLKGLFAALLIELVGSVVAFYRKMEIPPDDLINTSNAPNSPETMPVGGNQIPEKTKIEILENRIKELEKIDLNGGKLGPNQTTIGIKGCYLRKNRFEYHNPLSVGKSSIRLVGGSLCKYASEISELPINNNRRIDMILLDPLERDLIQKWFEVIPDDENSYCNDVIFTLKTIKRFINKSQIDLRLTPYIPLATLTLIDDVKLIVEYSFHKFNVHDRIMIEIDPNSIVGRNYLDSYQTLFDSCRRLLTVKDFDDTIHEWESYIV